MLRRRRGGLPPIITVLITLAAVVSAGLVAWFLFTITGSAVKQPVLEVTEAYYVSSVSSGSSGTLFLTVRNLGASDVTVTFATASCERGVSLSNSTYPPVTINKGSSKVIRYTSVSNIQDGDLCIVPVTITSPTSATITLQFRVVKP